MRNVWRIVRRDVRRVLRVPTAWVIVFGLVGIPALYAWVNIYGFWNPYNNTRAITVAVANEDEGATNAVMGEMHLGDQVEDQLRQNTQLGWQFMSEAEAMHAVESAQAYAAIVIPKDFSSSMSGLVTGGGTRPQIDYYVNEKASAVAPKITDVGASTLDQTINSTFVSTVSQVISSMANTAIQSAGGAADQSKQEIAQDTDEARAKVDDMRGKIATLLTELDQTPAKIQSARDAIATADRVAGDAASALGQGSDLILNAQRDAGTFTAAMSGTLDQGALLLSQASSGANLGISAVTGGMVEARHHIGFAIEVGQAVNQANAEAIASLEALNRPELADVIARLKAQNERTAGTLNDLGTLNDDATATTTAVGNAADALNAATQNTLATMGGAADAINGTTLPQLNNGIVQLAGAGTSLSSTIAAQRSLIAQTNAVLDQLDSTLATTGDALRKTDANLATLQTRLETVSTDVSALSASAMLEQLFGKDGSLDVARIADFMMSPTVLSTQTLFPLNSYGSGMAPLFTDLAMWVGAFALVVIVKLEVDDEGLEDLRLTATQRYMGRWLLLAPLAVAQAILVTVGDLVLGVQTVNAPMFVLTAILSSLTYLSIIYALATSFQHVGKGLCVLLVIVQIPGASGLYPIEMMPAFFRRVYPLFPFTYSIDAMRETVGGFYDGLWLRNAACLMVFVALSFVLGIAVRPYLANLNSMFARQIAESDMINGEEFHTPSRGPKLSQAILVLSDHEEYRRSIELRVARFAALYPKLKRGALVAGILVPAVFCVVFGINTNLKLAALASWIIWLLLIIGFLLVIETTRDRLERQMQLGNLSDEAIRNLIYEHQYERHAARKARSRGRSRFGRGWRARPGDDATRSVFDEARDHAPASDHATTVATTDAAPTTANTAAGADPANRGRHAA
ncbi:ABC-2 family transporter protein [Bifidobacterium sp. DSM 109958]|uniref:ABC-2 family transporter protein n=1 Tax=Bifidobacterium moraviense TaxID=2675323 RepID=A0A7Y0F3U8_9BIFI|nr:YhgE/Pip domain-containing protein [Bifidobacterium sp. DSM 109958]NMN00542.1 ABC-2 family transporter protein [Bifidobacterium sp. DSM 109958]